MFILLKKNLQLLLNNHSTRAYNPACLFNDEIVVRRSAHLVVPLVEFLLGEIVHPCQITEAF